MSHPLIRVLLALAWTLTVSTAGAAPVGERAASEIVAEIAVTERALAAAAETAGRASEGYKAVARRFCDLVAELERAEASHAELARLLPERWQLQARALDRAGEVDAELVRRLAAAPDGALAWPTRAMLVRVRMQLARGFPADALARLAAAFDDAAARHGARPEFADLFFEYATFRTDDTRVQAELMRRFLEQFPQHRMAGQARERVAQLGRVGEVFELQFVDALGGKTISTKDLRGKVLVVDFWATWCGPCMREMPRMKELYAKYKDLGVEFLGVSLDKKESEGGLQSLVSVCSSQGLTWPQYYQGNYWQSEFSSSWGIRSIPAVFLVDHEGKLVTTQARGKLEQLIPRELERAKAARK